MNEFGIIGNKRIQSLLSLAVKTGKTAGCYVLEGPLGSGKRTIARAFAAALCCKNVRRANGESNEPLFTRGKGDELTFCGECSSCKRILNGESVDVTELSPDKSSGYSVELIREMCSDSYVLPSEEEYRIFIILNGELLNAESQNALLKSIEEPAKNVVFFILTKDKTLLLPTVLSRAVKLNTERLSDEDIVKRLKKTNPEKSDEEINNAVRFSDGSLGLASSLLSDSDVASYRGTVSTYFECVLKNRTFEALCGVLPPVKSSQKQLQIILPLMKIAIRDIMLYGFDGFKAGFFDDDELLSRLSASVDRKRLALLFDCVESSLLYLSVNISPLNTVTNLNALSAKL